jgi:ankyrin repeat protein
MLSIAGGRGAAASEATIIEAIKLCLERGVDVDAFIGNGQTAVHLAAARGLDRVVKFLAEKGATLDLKDKQRRTPP